VDILLLAPFLGQSHFFGTVSRFLGAKTQCIPPKNEVMDEQFTNIIALKVVCITRNSNLEAVSILYANVKKKRSFETGHGIVMDNTMPFVMFFLGIDVNRFAVF